MSDSSKKNNSKEENQKPIIPEIISDNQQESLDVSPTRERFAHSVQGSHTTKAALEEAQEIKKHFIKREIDTLEKQAQSANTYKFIALLAIGILLGLGMLLYIYLFVTGKI